MLRREIHLGVFGTSRCPADVLEVFPVEKTLRGNGLVRIPPRGDQIPRGDAQALLLTLDLTEINAGASFPYYHH
ncbi:hypothetical protein Tco_0836288 [Tanacetum coccineum]